MAEARVRQLVAWQLSRIEARNRRSEQDRFREQEYFRMFQYSDGEPSGYRDEIRNVDGGVRPRLGQDSAPFSLTSSRHSLLDDFDSCTESRGSMPNIIHDGTPVGQSAFLHRSLPSGLHGTFAVDPESPRADQPNTVSPPEWLPKAGDGAENTPPGGFQRNFGIRRSRSFSGQPDIGTRNDEQTPREARKPVLHRRDLYGSTPALSNHMISHVGWMGGDVFGGMWSPPPPVDNRPLSPSSVSFPLSSWSSASSITGNWQSRKIEEEVEGESKKTVILAKQKAFNENCCMRCFSRFIFIINQKVQCYQCKYYVCKNCSEYDSNRREYVCNVCKKQRELQNQSLNWFYDSVKNKFKRFGSAKVVRSLYKRRLDSDSETEIRHEPSTYSSEPIGRRSRQGLHGLFELDLDQPDKEIRNDEEDRKEDGEKTRCRSRCFSTPYSCPVGTGRETFDQVKEAELNTYRNHLPCIIESIHRTLDTYSPAPGEIHKQERNLLSEQKSQLASLLLSLSQSLHIAVDNQDPTQNMSSPVAKHQLVNDILVREVERFTDRPVTLASVTRDGTQSCEEQLANIILNKIVDDYHQKALQRAKDDESDVRRTFAKLSNHATLEQIKDRYVSGSETDITSSQFDEPMSDVDNPSMDRSYTADEPAKLVNAKLTNGLRGGEGQGKDIAITTEKSVQSPRDSDSGIVSSPTAESMTSLRQGSEESEEQMVNHGLVNGGMAGQERQDLAKIGPFVEGNEWNVISKLMVKDQNSNLSEANIPLVPDDELDDIVTNNLINEKWSVVESRPSCVLSDDEDDNDGRASATKKSVQSAKGASDKPNDVFGCSSEDVNSRLGQMKRDFAKNKAIPITRQEHSEEVGSLTDSDVTIGEAKASREEDDDEGEDESFDAERVRVPLPSFSTSHRLSFESADLDDISSFHCNDDEDNISTFSTEISFGRTWNFSHTERLFRDSGRISAYDNFGEKKVGRDIEGPVIMLVPDGEDKSTTVKVGDRDLDELSDLSENLTHSDATPEGSEDDEDEGLDDDNIDDDDDDDYPSPVKGKRRKSTNEDRESSTFTQKDASERHSILPRDVQKITKTDTVQASSGKTHAVNDSNSAESKPTITAEKLLALEVVSTEKEESDPKFLLRPQDVTVMEGEVATFSCKVSGTEPIDVFWHKEGQDIVQLNDDESCDTRYDDSTYFLDIYNTRRYDQSQILCIGVNDCGRCVQGVRLFVQENPGDKKAPEFLKPLHDVDVKVGARVKFRVKLSGYPQPKVNWYKDGKKLRSSEQCKLEKHGNRDYVLFINYATLDDDAEYTVVARNIIGEARSSAQLVVDEGGSDGEFSSLGSSRISLPLSPQPSQTAPVVDSYPTDSVSGLYPDTEELLKLADKVSQTRGDVTTTASKMLRSAGQMSTLHHQLDEMDQKLNVIETEVKDTDHASMETNAYKELYREQILQEHEEMQTSASAVRNITSATINLLQSTNDVIESNKESQGVKRKSELISVAPMVDKAEELVELKLTFLEFEKLYNIGKITRQQMHSGMVPRPVYNACMQYLRAEADFKERSEKSHDLVVNDLPPSVDCGLKRIDSKRYKRDYIINKDKASTQQKSMDMRRGSSSGSDIVRSTPAGLREDPHEKITEAQEQIYLAAGRVNHLQEKIESLEDKVMAADDGSVANLEDQVARTAAQVKSSEEKVSLVEQQIRALESLTKKVEKEPVKVKRRSSSSSSDHSMPSPQSESRPQAAAGDGTRQKVTQAIKLKPLVMPNSTKQLSDASAPTADSKASVADVKTPPSVVTTPSATNKTPSADVRTPSAIVKAAPAAAKTAPADARATPAVSKSPPATPPVTPPVIKSPEPVKSSLKPRPESIDLHGETPEDVLPESRTETEPSFSLPSVKSLKSKFDHSSVSGADKDGASNFKRVYSLTGRDLPRTVREKLKAQGPKKVINPNIRSVDSTQPQSLLSVFERSDRELNEPRSSTPILNASQQESSQRNEKATTSMSLNLSHVSNIDVQSPSSSERTKNASTTKVSERKGRSETEVTLQSQTNPTSPKDGKLNRRKSSTILARAAFWDSRINQEVVSDTQADVEKFPQMPVENFKSMNSTL